MWELMKIKIPGDNRTFSRSTRQETYVWGINGYQRDFNVPAKIEKLLDKYLLEMIEKKERNQRAENERMLRGRDFGMKAHLASAESASKFHGGVWMEVDASQSLDKHEQLFRVAPFWGLWIKSRERSISITGKSKSLSTIAGLGTEQFIMTEKANSSAIFLLPIDLQLELLDHLDVATATCFGLTCKAFHATVVRVHGTKISLRTKGAAGPDSNSQKALWVLLQSWVPSGMIWSPADRMFIRRDFYKGGATARKWVEVASPRHLEDPEQDWRREKERQAKWAEWKAQIEKNMRSEA